MAEQAMRRVAVVGGVRIPFCRAYTGYVDLTNLDMATTALSGLVKRYELEGAHIDEVVGGAVVTQSADWNFAREVVLGTKLAASTPGTTMMQACGTSLQAALDLSAKIAVGEIESGIAMGADTISDAPIVFKRRFAHRLAAVNRARGMGAKLSALKGFSFGELAPVPPSTSEPRTGLSMGEHAELMAKQWEIPREAQDELAYESHKKAAAAYDEGFMDDLLVPCAGIFRDNNLRADIDLAKMAELKPAFDRSGKGTLTAANSTPLTDGAACVLLASEEWARARGLPIQAYLTMGQTAALDFVAGEGLLMAPTFAVNRLLRRANLKLQEFDYYEIHEAFAAQVLCTLKAFESPEYCKQVLGRDEPLGTIDRAKLNVKGSSIAFGHPFAATGARIMGNLAKLLTQTPNGRGLISVCTAGGMGVVAIFEGVERVGAAQRADGTKEGAEGEATPGEGVSAGPSDPASTLP